MNAANNTRSYNENRRMSVIAATRIVEFIAAMPIQLPPVRKLENVASPKVELAKVGGLVKTESGPVVRPGKLIIP